MERRCKLLTLSSSNNSSLLNKLINICDLIMIWRLNCVCYKWCLSVRMSARGQMYPSTNATMQCACVLMDCSMQQRACRQAACWVVYSRDLCGPMQCCYQRPPASNARPAVYIADRTVASRIQLACSLLSACGHSAIWAALKRLTSSFINKFSSVARSIGLGLAFLRCDDMERHARSFAIQSSVDLRFLLARLRK